MKRTTLFLALFAMVCAASGQEAAPAAPAPPPEIDEAYLLGIVPRELGPTNMGGRILDVAVYEKAPRIIYLATASGGLWKTENAGITWRAVFDREGMVAVGAVAVSHSSPDVVWLGTGEGSSRNSSSWGDGVYKSVDGGKTWEHVGLRETRHVSRVLIHPRNPDIVYVGALGHLWGPNEERGLYKTTDGGKAWQRVLYVDEYCGIADVAMDPKNPETLLAAPWRRMRWAYRWESGGPGSGMWKTTNGGRNWRKIERGMPPDPIGRIGISYHRADPKVVYATIEARGDGVGTYRSADGGESWTRVNRLNPRPFYFSRPHADPVDPKRIYICGVSLHVSEDSGATFRVIGQNVHSDRHAFWVDPNDPFHLIDGNDGGIAESRDRGQTWRHIKNLPLGQFYAVSYDMRKPYWVYGGLQDNGSWAGPSQSLRGAVSDADFTFLTGGDGFYTANDPEDWRIVYSESQNGGIVRTNLATGETRSIRPRPPQGERYRFNWSTPIMLSPHNPRIVYVGGNRLFRSLDRGDNWQVISPDLSTNDPEKQKPGGGVSPENTGAETHCTIVTISESRLKPGLIWVGTDDGLVHVTQDHGANWTKIEGKFPGLPPSTWCTRVEASKFVEGRAYVTFDGHRNNDYIPYVYVTEDFGASWKSISTGLLHSATCHVIREGARNEDLLLLGTEMGLWVSVDRGQTWHKYNSGTFPNVPVHDIQVHHRDHDAILGTHGRSIWIMPLGPLEQLTANALSADVTVYEPAPAYLLGRIAGSWFGDDASFRSPNTQPGTTLYYWFKSAPNTVRITVSDVTGRNYVDIEGAKALGLNSTRIRLVGRSQPPEGTYLVTLKVDDKSFTTTLRVEAAEGQR